MFHDSQKTSVQLGILLAILLGSVVVANAELPPSGELLSSLRAWDEMVAPGVYVETDAVVPPSIFDSASLSLVQRIRFTTWDDNYAIEETFVAQLPGTSKPALVAGLAGNGRGAIPLQRVYVFNNGRSDSYESAAMEFDEDDEPRLDGQTREMVMRFNPDDDNDIDMALQRYRYSLGRGFSTHLSSITTVEALPSGLIHLEAGGEFRRGETGTWKIDVDPDSGLLVRSAEFFATGNEFRTFKVTTEGTLDTGTWLAPKRAVFALFAAPNRDSNYEYDHALIRPEKNEDFYEACEAVFDKPLEDNSIVRDARGESDVYTTIGANPPPARQPGPGSSTGFPKTLLIAINAIVVGLILLVLVFRNTRKPQ